MRNTLETLLGVPLVDDAPLDALLPAVLPSGTAAWPPVGVLLAGYTTNATTPFSRTRPPAADGGR